MFGGGCKFKSWDTSHLNTLAEYDRIFKISSWEILDFRVDLSAVAIGYTSYLLSSADGQCGAGLALELQQPNTLAVLVIEHLSKGE